MTLAYFSTQVTAPTSVLEDVQIEETVPTEAPEVPSEPSDSAPSDVPQAPQQ